MSEVDGRWTMTQGSRGICWHLPEGVKCLNLVSAEGILASFLHWAPSPSPPPPVAINWINCDLLLWHSALIQTVMRLFIPFVQNSQIRTTYPISTWSAVAYALYLSRVCNELQLLDGLDSFKGVLLFFITLVRLQNGSLHWLFLTKIWIPKITLQKMRNCVKK